MSAILHFFGLFPQLSNGQLVMMFLVWIGCYVWRAMGGAKAPAHARMDRCLGVKVTTGVKDPAVAPAPRRN